MRTLHVVLRVSDLELSVAFYTAVGYTVVGTVEGTAFGSLAMLRLPGDGFVTIELVYDPARAPSTSAPASTTSSSKSSRWTRPSPILPRRGS
jgi:catechol 2,3-dioxygenase-like lactoylglutathione lyase family enzyme